MREQRVFDKLRGSEEAAACLAGDSPSPKTFLPNIEKCEYTAAVVLESLV